MYPHRTTTDARKRNTMKRKSLLILHENLDTIYRMNKGGNAVERPTFIDQNLF